MSYSAGEALALAQIRNLIRFDTTNTSRGNFRLPIKGGSAHYAIIWPGDSSREYMSPTHVKSTWTTNIRVFQRRSMDGTDLTDLQARVDEIVGRFDEYRLMGDAARTVVDAYIATVGTPTERSLVAKPGITWLTQDLALRWIEEETITFGE